MMAENPEEFVRLMGASEHSVMAYILSLAPNWHDAQDIAQETRVKLWNQFSEYDRTKDFGAWALTIAYWEVKRFRKQRGRDKVRFGDETVESFAEMVKDVVPDTEERHGALAACLESLDATRRRMLALYYSGESTTREIAEQEGRSHDSVRKSLLRTRLRLRECVERTLRREGGK